MKKLLLIAALAAMSTPAFASKARLTSLGNADHLVDVQTAFDNPAHLTLLSDYATFETGPTSTTSTTSNAEGGFIQSMGEGKWGFYMGRKSEFTTGARASTGFLGQENPIELQYAMKGPISWGAALNYSKSDKKSVSRKQDAMGVRVGAVADVWEAYAIIGLGSKADGHAAFTADLNGDGDVLDAGETAAANPATTTGTYKSTTGFKVGAKYKMDNIVAYLKHYMDGFKYEDTGTAITKLEQSQSQTDLGVIDATKIDGGQWFYGVALRLFNSKKEATVGGGSGEAKTTTTSLPFLLGLEYDAASWLTLRTSVTQNVLIGTTKTEVGGTGEADTIANNTTVAAGLGLKMNKWTLDGSMAAATTGNLQLGDGATTATQFVTNMALTYNF